MEIKKDFYVCKWSDEDVKQIYIKVCDELAEDAQKWAKEQDLKLMGGWLPEMRG